MVEEQTIKKQVCKRCNFEWWPRKINIDAIKQCPHCKSTLWNQDRIRNVYNKYTEEK